MNNQFAILKACFLTSMLTLFVSCGSEPGVTVENPREYVINELKTAELRAWWEPYRNMDQTFLEEVVDDFISRQRNGLPSDSKKLDALMRRITNSYQIRCYSFINSGDHTLIYQIKPNQQMVRKSSGAPNYTKLRVDWNDLMAGKINLQDRTWYGPMEGEREPPLEYVARDSLPLKSNSDS